jgi:hypothetical protein
MATVKRKASGAVVLKDGKVSCGCCAQAGCCPYPAQALVDGLYTYQDLPDAIDIDSIEFTKLDPPQSIGGVNQYYINTYGEYLGIESMPSDSVWAYEGGNNACLLNDSGWEDQFADSYTVTPNIGDSASPTVVTRISPCVWRGTDTCGNFVYLSYGSNPNGGQDIMWNVFFRFYIPTCLIDGQVDGQKNDDEFKNTPVGTYSGTFEDAAFVS